jgi:hypothetical protein
MDGLSSAASVIAVIQIAQSIGSALKDYYESVRDAREDIRKLYDSVKSLEIILSTIQNLLNLRRDEALLNSALLKGPSGPLKQAELELQKLNTQLKILPSHQRGLGKALRSLTWPFFKKDVEKAVVCIDRHKSSLILEIGVENL